MDAERVESTKPTSDSSDLFQIPGPDFAEKFLSKHKNKVAKPDTERVESSNYTFDFRTDQGSQCINLFQPPKMDAAKEGESSKFTYDPGSFGERRFSNISRGSKMEFSELHKESIREGATKLFHDEIPKSKIVAEPEVQRKKWPKVVFLLPDIGEYKGFPLCDLKILDKYREEAKKNEETEKEKNAV